MRMNIPEKNISIDFPNGYFNDLFYEKRQRIYDCFTFFNEQDLLEIRLEELYEHVDGGWHFSYLGDIQSIINKMKSLEHPELERTDYSNPKKIKEDIEQGKFSLSSDKLRYVEINDSFPKSVLMNKDKYCRLMKQ